MVIMTQDKRTIVNTDNLNYIEVVPNGNGTFDLEADYSHSIVTLGTYKNDTRANEILQDMYKQLMQQNFSFTYEMPKE